MHSTLLSFCGHIIRFLVESYDSFAYLHKVTSPALCQPYACHSVSEVTLKDMDQISR